MNFLFPAAFFFAALAPAIVILYLRRPRRLHQQVSTLLFWERVLERAPRRKFFGHLRRPFSLLLQLLVFALLLFALARPQRGDAHRTTSTVVVLDLRARMQPVFPAALREAEVIASGAGPGTEVAVLGLEKSPRVLAPFSEDPRKLRETLKTLTPSDAGGDPAEALQLAERLLESRDGKTGDARLIWISDRPCKDRPGWENHLVGQPAPNLALLTLAQRPLPNSPQSSAIFLQAANFSPSDQSVEVELALDGRPFDLRLLPLPAGQTTHTSVVVPAELLQGSAGKLTARLLTTDTLAFDNTAYAVLPATEKPRVLLITKNNPFLESALKADPGLSVEILEPETWKAGLGAGFDAVIFDHWLPEGATLESLGPGQFLFYGRSPFDGETADLPGVSWEDVDSQNPLFWNVNLDAARIYRAARLSPPEGAGWRISSPARSAGEPLILTLENPSGARHLATAFGIEGSNLALLPGFPLFIGNAVRWLAHRPASDLPPIAAGEIYQPEKDEKIAAAPAEENAAEPASWQETSVRLRKNGFYPVETPAGRRWLAVNTLSPVESDLRESQSAGTRTGLAGRWPVLHLWQWLTLAALVLMLLEWRWHHRRITE